MYKSIISLGITLIMGTSFASDMTKVSNYKKRPLHKVNVVVNDERTVVLKGPIMPDNSERILDAFKTIVEKGKGDIYFVINSPGGSVLDGFEIINLITSIKKEKGINTICVVESEASSMAAVIALFCHQTFMLRNSSIMFHEATYGVQDSASHIASRVEFMKRYLYRLELRIANQMGISYSDYANKILREWWLNADEAATIGIVDGITDNLYYTAQPIKTSPGFFFMTKKQSDIVINPARNIYEDFSEK